MKQLVSYLSVAAMILVACACNKQDQPDEASGKMNDLQYLIDGLVRTDDAGNITGYMIGDCLNEANPWEISVPVNNYEEAAAIFRDLLPDGPPIPFAEGLLRDLEGLRERGGVRTVGAEQEHCDARREWGNCERGGDGFLHRRVRKVHEPGRREQDRFAFGLHARRMVRREERR